MIYIFRKSSKDIGLIHDNKKYILGTKNSLISRSIIYNMHPTPQYKILKDKNEMSTLPGTVIKYTTSAYLWMNKYPGDIYSRNYELTTITEEEFFKLPWHGYGIVMPINIENETSMEYMFRVAIVDPINEKEDEIDLKNVITDITKND